MNYNITISIILAILFSIVLGDEMFLNEGSDIEEHHDVEYWKGFHGDLNEFAEKMKTYLPVSKRLIAEEHVNNPTLKKTEISEIKEEERDMKWEQISFQQPSFREDVRNNNKFEVELSSKSYIRPVDSLTCPQLCGDIDLACMAAAIPFCAAMGPVESDSESYGKSGNYRLYSKMTFEITCTDGKPSAISSKSRDDAIGHEGPLTPPPGEFDKVVHEIVDGEAHFGYMFSGRPHRVAELGMQGLRIRTCTWIWHYPFFKIKTCDANGGWEGEFQFGGSNFPTRRLWRNGDLIKTRNQDFFGELWHASRTDKALVRGWFPYDQRSEY